MVHMVKQASEEILKRIKTPLVRFFFNLNPLFRTPTNYSTKWKQRLYISMKEILGDLTPQQISSYTLYLSPSLGRARLLCPEK